MTMVAEYQINAGFMPLMDSALLVVAAENGFAAAEGIELTLVRETSWANIRDRLAVGHFHVAHMLGPMPIACNLGLTPLASRTLVPMALGLGGNAVTVSNTVWQAMEAHGAAPDIDPRTTGLALKNVIADRTSAGRELLRFAVVHPHSGHNYELRYWLAACSIDPESDVDIVIVPPPLMPEALAAGRIDGYCVGEPWNSVAAMTGKGRIATTKAAIWKSSPEKVLGAQALWADANPDALAALLRALYHAAQWCTQTTNHEELAALLARPGHLGTPKETILPALSGHIHLGGNGERFVADFFIPLDKAATFPWRSHALWYYTQMVRWGHIGHSKDNEAVAQDSYRPDLYRAALKPLGVALPGANSKVEGALTTETPVGSAGASLVLGPDGFFDGSIFDPDEIESYIAGQKHGHEND